MAAGFILQKMEQEMYNGIPTLILSHDMSGVRELGGSVWHEPLSRIRAVDSSEK